MGGRRQPLRHPLAELRTSVGHSHSSYAQLVAEVHQTLGFGAMAARREKVCRWESGRVEPELSAQFAIAHIHRVPREEVLRLGWPAWLHVPPERAGLLEAPWTLEEAVRALTASAGEEAVDPARDFTVMSTTAQLTRLVTSWWRALDGTGTVALPTPLTTERVGRDTVAALEQRHIALRGMLGHLGAATARPTADADLRLVAHLCKNARCGSATRTQLFAMAARFAAFSGFLAFDMGDQFRAQSCYVAALRAATAAGDRQTSAWAFMLLARQQLVRGDSRMAADLMDVADVAVRRAPPNARMSALLAITQAIVHADLGDRRQFDRYVDATFEAAAVPPGEGDPYFTRWASNAVMGKMAACAAVSVGEADRAPELYGTQARHLDAGPRPSNRNDAIDLSILGRVQLARGDVDAAVRCAEQVDDFLAGTTSVSARFVHGRLCADLSAHPATRAAG